MQFQVLHDDGVSHIPRGGREVDTPPEPSALIALAQFGELHLDAPGRPSFDPLHDIRQGQFGRDRQKNVDMATRQNRAHNVDAHFLTGLSDDLTDVFRNRTLTNRVAIFVNCNPLVISLRRR